MIKPSVLMGKSEAQAWDQFVDESDLADINDLNAALDVLDTMCWIEIGRPHNGIGYCAKLHGLPYQYPSVYCVSNASRAEAVWLCAFAVWLFEFKTGSD